MPLPINPLQVQFAHQTTHPASDYEDFFQAPVHFSEKQNAIIFEKDFLEFPIPHADPELLQYQQHLAAKKLEAFNQHKGYAAQVFRIIENHQAWHQLTTEDIADTLGYHNLSSFHRAFKRWYQTSPKAYRQEFRV